MIQPILDSVSDQCPDLVFTDSTDYSDLTASGTYQIHDYSGGLPTVSTGYSLTAITIDAVDVLGSTISLATDAAGNIIDPALRYNEIVDTVNAYQSVYLASLVQPDTNFKTWYVQFDIYGAGFAGEVVLAPTSPAGLTPALVNLVGGADSDVRNFALLLPDGTYADLGTAQVDQLLLNQASYGVGEIFTFTFCGSVLNYTVEAGETSATCVATGIAALANTTQAGDNHFNRLTAEATGSVVLFTSTVPGVPLQIIETFTQAPLSTYLTFSTITANSATMTPPDFGVTNTYTYTPSEDGGDYVATLTVVQDCDYFEFELEFNNWCFDLIALDCCLADMFLASSGTGCNSCKESIAKSNKLLSKIQAIPVLQAKNTTTESIQEVINSAKSICDGLKCCNDC